MSRIGRLPVKIPAGVTVTVNDKEVTVKGPLGTLNRDIDERIKITVDGDRAVLTRADDEKETKALHGLFRSLLFNMVEGVTKGYSKTLVVVSVGVKVAKNGNKLVMNIGYSHPVEFVEPEGITFEVANATANQVEVIVKGIDKVAVGQCAASIRAAKKVEPYHGYGIHYKDEVVVRKEGKTAGK